MSGMSRENLIKSLAREYKSQGYEVLGVEASYPGVLDKSVPEHELEGRADLVLSDPDNIRGLEIVEVACTGSLDPEIIEDRYIGNIEQAHKDTEYFEGLGYKVKPNAILEPVGNLRTLKEIWNNTTGAFTWKTAVESVSEPGRLGGMKENEEIIFEGLSKTESEIYSVNEELDDVLDLFYRDVI